MASTQVIWRDDIMWSIAISPDGQRLAVGLRKGGVQLLDARSGERRTIQVDVLSSTVYTVAFSLASASPMLLAAGVSDNVLVWDCGSGSRVAELLGHIRPVLSVAFSPDGRLLASASFDNTVRLWRTDDWHAPPAVLRGHTDRVTGVSFSCDSRLLASCSMDFTLQLWHITNSDTAPAASASAAGPVLEVGNSARRVAFSPVDSRLLACCGMSGIFVLARVGADGGAIAVERELQGHADAVRGLAFSPCGQQLASASYDETVRLWSVASGACLRVLRGHTDNVFSVAFFPNGKQLASCSDDETVRIWTVCAWSDKTHHLFGVELKVAVFTLMCVRGWSRRSRSRGRGRCGGGGGGGRVADAHCHSLGCPWRCGCWSLDSCSWQWMQK